MTQGKVHFRGILAITDSSITNIKLDYGFKIEKMDIDTAKSFISLWPTYKHNALFDKGCVVENNVYYISNSFSVQDLSDPFSPEIDSFRMKYNNGYENGYLDNIIKIMRLFHRGNISIPISIYYYFKNGIQLKSGGMKSKYGPGELLEFLALNL